MKKTIEVIIYEYNGITQVEGINDEGYTECQIPFYSLGIENKGGMIINDNGDKIYQQGEARFLVGKYIINGKELKIYRKNINVVI